DIPTPDDSELELLPAPNRLTPEERAAQDERDARLWRQFVRMKEPVGEEVAEIVAKYAWAVARRYRPWLLPRWDDFEGKILEKLFRQRAEKALREEQTLYEVARALVKAEGDKEVGLLKKESAARSFDDTSPKAVPRDVLETAVTMASPSRFKN